MKVSVIIPVYNEENTIEEIIAKIKEVPIEKEIIVVDDGSYDRTKEILRNIKDIKSIFFDKNQGKGSAIRAGLKLATGDIIIIQDADLEYNPFDYPKLIKPFLKYGKNIAVYGSRFKGGGRFLFLSRLANIILNFFTNLFFGSKISDMETCYKVLPREIMLSLNLKSKRFEIEPEITAKLLKKKIRIIEVPISYQARKAGKKIKAKDGIIALFTLLYYRIA
ncbi:MAG: glycosyltransferase family 2 protein [candidate division WOR-3 bacterium]|nr:glycosyltransferase family 2 protein [candidate division WOR-3 bacterium]MCX7836704.1 glycosyltransferase family 2 protein [candidate division WOR-3 bacterium]MDW8113459.1 glycosyltransferase family 2 protein [candidate division WOR-3 bacterium]